MTWKFEYSELLLKKLKKLKNKDIDQYRLFIKKREDIKNKMIINPDHFKNLRHDLKEFERVHIGKSFVLILNINKKDKILRFVDYDHHDKIYK